MTPKNPNFRICLSKKFNTFFLGYYCWFELMKSTIPKKCPRLFRDPKKCLLAKISDPIKSSLRSWRSCEKEANSISGAMLNKFKKRRKIGGKGVGEAILVPSPTSFPPIFYLLLNLFNMAPEIEFASSDFPPSHKTASYAGYIKSLGPSRQ